MRRDDAIHWSRKDKGPNYLEICKTDLLVWRIEPVTQVRNDIPGNAAISNPGFEVSRLQVSLVDRLTKEYSEPTPQEAEDHG